MSRVKFSFFHDAPYIFQHTWDPLRYSRDSNFSYDSIAMLVLNYPCIRRFSPHFFFFFFKLFITIPARRSLVIKYQMLTSARRRYQRRKKKKKQEAYKILRGFLRKSILIIQASEVRRLFLDKGYTRHLLRRAADALIFISIKIIQRKNGKFLPLNDANFHQPSDVCVMSREPPSARDFAQIAARGDMENQLVSGRRSMATLSRTNCTETAMKFRLRLMRKNFTPKIKVKYIFQHKNYSQMLKKHDFSLQNCCSILNQLFS